MQELAGRMLEVVQKYIDDPRARVDARERLGRAARRIRYVYKLNWMLVAIGKRSRPFPSFELIHCSADSCERCAGLSHLPGRAATVL